ncbi:MAG: hypothetical protein SGILL_009273, partial [Bacillariaceae sp.]
TDASNSPKLPAAPISLRQHGIAKTLDARYEQAKELAALEQEVEDWNAAWVASAKNRDEACTRRRLICLPLDERFNPPMGMFSHDHVQNGDKMSIPKNFQEAIQRNNLEVPWLCSVSRVEGVTKPPVELEDVHNGLVPEKMLREVVAGPLDHRAPANYCFLPLWIMRALRLHPRDIVEVKVVKDTPAGTFAKFRPHSSDFAKDISQPQAVLETELRHYSSLTRGATIPLDYNGKRYWLDVEDLRCAPRGEKASMVKMQDCDVATDFMMSKEDRAKKLEERRRKLLEQQNE